MGRNIAGKGNPVEFPEGLGQCTLTPRAIGPEPPSVPCDGPPASLCRYHGPQDKVQILRPVSAVLECTAEAAIHSTL